MQSLRPRHFGGCRCSLMFDGRDGVSFPEERVVPDMVHSRVCVGLHDVFLDDTFVEPFESPRYTRDVSRIHAVERGHTVCRCNRSIEPVIWNNFR